MKDDLLYPSAVEAERAVLGAILLDEGAANVAVDLLQTTDFYRDSHRIIFESVRFLTSQSTPVDLVTLADHLRGRGELERIGGEAALGEMAQETATAANVEAHARLIIDKAKLRRLMEATERIRQNTVAGTAPVGEILDAAEREIFEISLRRSSREPVPITDLLGRTFDRIDELTTYRDRLTGVTSGFADLDAMTSGFQKSDLIILAGRPSMGKSSLAVNMMEAVALEDKKPVIFFSMEMNVESVVMRFLSSTGRVPFKHIRTGHVTESEMTDLANAAERFSHARLFIDDSVNLTPIEMRSRCRRIQAKLSQPLGLIVVDYLQLMSSGKRIDNRVQEVSDISRTLKAVARELETPVIALSQLSRAPEQRTDRKPQLSDLRDSGAIEQDADLVAFIHRQDYAGSGPGVPSGGGDTAELLIRKHRNGETGSVPLVFMGELMRFESAAREGDYGPDGETAVIG